MPQEFWVTRNNLFILKEQLRDRPFARIRVDAYPQRAVALKHITWDDAKGYAWITLSTGEHAFAKRIAVDADCRLLIVGPEYWLYEADFRTSQWLLSFARRLRNYGKE